MAQETNGFVANGDTCEDFDEVEVPVPWGHISGKWWGPKDRQPILAIHGWQDNAGTFDNLAPLLVKENMSLFCIDLPGHGYSSHYPMGSYYYIFWDGVHLIRRIVKHFNWKNITLLGHSLGGGMSFLYAAIFPSDVKKFISIDIASPAIRNSSSYDKLGVTVDKFLEYENIPEDKAPSYTYDEMLDVVQKAYENSASRDSCRILMKRGMKPSPNGGYHFSRDLRLKVCALGMFSLEQTMDFASKIKCEVLNLRGDPGLRFDKPEYYNMVLDEIQKSAKRVERHVIPGKHHFHMDHPESILGFVVEFLKT